MPNDASTSTSGRGTFIVPAIVGTLFTLLWPVLWAVKGGSYPFVFALGVMSAALTLVAAFYFVWLAHNVPTERAGR